MRGIIFEDVYVPLYNGLTVGEGANVAGLSNSLAGLAAGNTDFENNFYNGKKEYEQRFNQVKDRHPILTILEEAAGTGLAGGAIAKLLKSGLGVAEVLRNSYQIRKGANQLEKALSTQKFTDEPIFVGRLNKERLDAVNEMLRNQGGKELESNKIFWTRKGQEHLHKGRIAHDGSSPKEVSQWQKEVFFGKRSEPFLNKEKYPNDGALKTPYANGNIEGYLSNEEGKTVGRTIIKKRKR